MVNRVYIKNLISFKEIELELEKGLVVISGPSGAGKSLFMNSILSTFGHGASEASLCEVLVTKPPKLQSDAFEFEDEITLKCIKKEKTRHFIDGQNISKRVLSSLFAPFVQYLSVRDKGGFESKALLELVDATLLVKNKEYKKMLKEYHKRYAHYKQKLSQLKKIKEDESKLAELIEFSKFEIEKIENINPTVGEDEELLKVKQQLSRIDKVTDALNSATAIFGLEESVSEVYRLLDKDDSIFLEMMNQLRADFDDIESLTEELAEVDIEYILNRLEEISTLKNRYGGIEEALNYMDEKKKELAGYENIEQDKSMLESFLSMEYAELMIIASKISMHRQEEAQVLAHRLESYLRELKLPAIQFIFSTIEIGDEGIDKIALDLNGSSAQTLSGGEFNRVRLALMVVALSGVKNGGVLILDEIDANVSGDESIAIANMIAKLASVYQIFAISHQAHLASKANQHVLIIKEQEISHATLLNKQGQMEEIARIIGGEKPNKEALSFANKLLN